MPLSIPPNGLASRDGSPVENRVLFCDRNRDRLLPHLGLKTNAGNSMTDAKEPTHAELGEIFHGASLPDDALFTAITKGNRAVFNAGREFERSLKAETRDPTPTDNALYAAAIRSRRNLDEPTTQDDIDVSDRRACFDEGVAWAESGRFESPVVVVSEAEVERLAKAAYIAIDEDSPCRLSTLREVVRAILEAQGKI